MWISKKKFEKMIAEAVEKERERAAQYRFMDDVHMRLSKLECIVEKNTEYIQNNKRSIRPPSETRKLNG